MHEILQFSELAYVEAHNLMPLLKDYTNPRDCIARLVHKGELIRLKNGFYLIRDKLKYQKTAPYEQIANLLYGPSYISFEWALSYYGIIPEGTFVVTSASLTKSKSYKTSIGTFDYFFLNIKRYAIGIDQKENSSGNFLIATPEKALADLVHKKCKNLSAQELLIDLIEARRIDSDVLKNLNKKHLTNIAENYRSTIVNTLLNVVGLL